MESPEDDERPPSPTCARLVTYRGFGGDADLAELAVAGAMLGLFALPRITAQRRSAERLKSQCGRRASEARCLLLRIHTICQLCEA